VAPKATLIRLAVLAGGPAGARAVIDRDQALPGRGAYLCPDPTGGPCAPCLGRATRKGGLTRALRASVPLDREFVESTG